LEFDVRLTRDGVPVVIHDATLDRTTSGSGLVADVSHVELSGFDAGAKFTTDGGRSYPYRARGLLVPTLDELLSRYGSMPLLIEVKVAEAVEPTRRMLQEHDAMSRTVVDSTLHAAVAPFRGRDGAIATGASMKEVAALLRHAWLPGSPRSLPYEALCIPRWYYGLPIPVTRLARMARRAGAVTHVWTVNSPPVARRFWLRGIHGVITDDPGAMLRARRLLFGPS
jgi:glycerophosphoryl diester phosphodiesterase